jgi:hypothetical protein
MGAFRSKLTGDSGGPAFRLSEISDTWLMQCSVMNQHFGKFPEHGLLFANVIVDLQLSTLSRPVVNPPSSTIHELPAAKGLICGVLWRRENGTCHPPVDG